MATDLQIATYTLSSYPPAPYDFIPDGYDPPPLEPASLETMFGALSVYEYKLIFNEYFNQESNTWTTDSTITVSPEIRSDIQEQLDLISAYVITYRTYIHQFTIDQDVAWRRKIALAILS